MRYCCTVFQRVGTCYHEFRKGSFRQGSSHWSSDSLLPHTFFLVPGYGAQGGGAEGVSKAFDDHGLGAIVNSSRGVMCAYKKEDNCDEHDFAKAARREVIRMKEDIISYLPKITLE